MEQDKLTQLIQLKIMEKLGVKAAESPEMKALTEEISGLFTKQNKAYVGEIKQLQQAITELSKQQQSIGNIMVRLVKRLNNQDAKMQSMNDVIDEIAEMIEPEEECSCYECCNNRRIAREREYIANFPQFQVIRVTK